MATKTAIKKTTPKKESRDKPISLYPLPFEEALAALAKVRPKKKITIKKQPKKKQPD